MQDVWATPGISKEKLREHH